MKKLIYGADPHALQSTGPQPLPSIVTAAELAKLGIAPRNIPRIRQELARLVDADPALRDHATLIKVAKQLAGQFL